MFESQLQSAQFAFGGSIICTTVAVLVFMFGTPAVGVLFLVLASVTGGIGGWLFADIRGYPPALGLGLGIGFGVAVAIFLLILPDRSTEREAEEAKEREAELRERKRRSKNYEVLDDDDE